MSHCCVQATGPPPPFPRTLVLRAVHKPRGTAQYTSDSAQQPMLGPRRSKLGARWTALLPWSFFGGKDRAPVTRSCATRGFRTQMDLGDRALIPLS